MLTAAVWVSSAVPAQPYELTAKERQVCASLKTCLDIIRRHDASEFDYAVIEDELRRFGPKTQNALFDILKSDSGHADIAKLITALGPLSPQLRQNLQRNWSPEKAQVYLPLLKDANRLSRDLLLRSLAHPSADVREQARIALLRLPENVRRLPVSDSLTDPLLAALQFDPIGEAAPYLSRLNSLNKETQFALLLRSGQADIVSAAYASLYRNSPSRAFNLLLAEMERLETPAQSRAIGQMLARRNQARPDGFYLKFATDMSGDPKLPPRARAAGLHALMVMKPQSFPNLSPARAEALSFLIKGQPFIVQDKYLPFLKAAGADRAMGLIWKIAKSENWINLDRIASFYSGHSAYDAVIKTLLKSNAQRSFARGLSLAKPSYNALIKSRINAPVTPIANAARRRLRLPALSKPNQNCRFKAIDLEDMRTQMPFFDEGWMVTDNQTRLSLKRSYLTSAYPSRTGWLAAYDVGNSRARSAQSGGTLLHYDNQSGLAQDIAGLSAPMAVLPNRALRLGDTTSQFWIIDRWGGDALDVSAYRLNLTQGAPRLDHIVALPYNPKGFAVAGNGDLFVNFADKDQPAIRVSPTGQVRLACAVQPMSPRAQAPQ